MDSSPWKNLNHLFYRKGLFLTVPHCQLGGVDQCLKQTWLYLWYSLFQWNKYNVRAVTIYDFLQHATSDNIRSATIYNYLQYAIGDNIKLSTIYDQLQYTIIYNIRSATTYDYLQYTIIYSM